MGPTLRPTSSLCLKRRVRARHPLWLLPRTRGAALDLGPVLHLSLSPVSKTLQLQLLFLEILSDKSSSSFTLHGNTALLVGEGHCFVHSLGFQRHRYGAVRPGGHWGGHWG